MRNFILSAVASFALAVVAVPASAMPSGSVSAQALPLASAQPELTLVSGGCGPFRHRAFNGFCYPGGGFRRPFYRPFGYYRPYRRFYHRRFHRFFF